jgi:hypothetical protein
MGKGNEKRKRRREKFIIMGMLLVGKHFEKRKDSNILAGDATHHKPTFWTKWWSLKSDKLLHLLAKRKAPSLGWLGGVSNLVTDLPDVRFRLRAK